MSPSTLAGAPVVETTRYVYEGDHVIEAVTVRSSEYTADDLALLRASVERDRTNQYGIPLDEAYDEDSQFSWTAGSVVDYSVAAVEREKKRLSKQYPDDPMWGRVFYPKRG